MELAQRREREGRNKCPPSPMGELEVSACEKCPTVLVATPLSTCNGRRYKMETKEVSVSWTLLHPCHCQANARQSMDFAQRKCWRQWECIGNQLEPPPPGFVDLFFSLLVLGLVSTAGRRSNLGLRPYSCNDTDRIPTPSSASWRYRCHHYSYNPVAPRPFVAVETGSPPN